MPPRDNSGKPDFREKCLKIWRRVGYTPKVCDFLLGHKGYHHYVEVELEKSRP
jgi:hypothetical protein